MAKLSKVKAPARRAKLMPPQPAKEPTKAIVAAKAGATQSELVATRGPAIPLSAIQGKRAIKPVKPPHSKQAAILILLRRAEGASIAQLSKATGWQAHSVRGVISGVLKKKLGLTIKSEKSKGGERTYRIA